MIQCRMCSRRLTQPGKLCRDCESELDAMRSTGSTVVPLLEADPAEAVDARRWTRRMRSKPAMLVLAFAAGIVAAAAIHLAGLKPS